MPKLIKLKPIRSPLNYEASYRTALLVIIEQMRQGLYSKLQTNNAQTNAQYQAAIEDILGEYISNPMLGVTIASTFVKNLDSYHQRLFSSDVKRQLGVDVNYFISKSAMQNLMHEAISWNVDLIKSIPNELLPQLKQVVSESFSELGFDQAHLKKQIDQRFNVTKSRAKLIARDQTSKTIGNMNQFRQQALGINEYIWLGVDDQRERATHVANNNKRFNYNNPPASTGNPGQDFQCRCSAQAIVTEQILNNLHKNNDKVV